MSVTIGGSPDSWGVWAPRDDRQVPWDRFLDEVAEVGYEWIEAGPYGYLPTDIPTLRRELDSRGLKICATTVMAGHLEEPSDWPKVESAMMGAGELGAGMGATYMVLIDATYRDLVTGKPVLPPRLEESAWKRLIETTQRVADLALEEFGLSTVFHAHAETHVEYESDIEAFLEQTDPDRVSLCLDTGHHAYAGGEPVSFMRKHHGRVSHIHLKSVDGDVLQRVRDDDTPIVAATKMGVFCEPSEGVVDFAALSNLLREIRYEGWAIVEQDMRAPPPGLPLAIAKRTREYLLGLGFG